MSSHLDSASAAAAAAAVSQNNNKRKLDDYISSDDDVVLLISSKMRKDQFIPSSSASSDNNNNHRDDHLQQQELRHSVRYSSSLTESTQSPRLQFFVRDLAHNSLVIYADRYDTVESVHKKISTITGMRIELQRLIYKGKHLEWDKTLEDYDIDNDSNLILVARLRSSQHPQAWQHINVLLKEVFNLCRDTNTNIIRNNNNNYMLSDLTGPFNSLIKSRLTEFINMIPRIDTQHSPVALQASDYLEIFLACSVPRALVMLYTSLVKDNRKVANEAIQHFITQTSALPEPIHIQCAPIILEFCKLLSRRVGNDDPLYIFCRSSLGSIMDNMLIGTATDSGGTIDVREIFPFVSELSLKLSQNIRLSTDAPLFLGPTLSDVRDFSAFLSPLRKSVMMQVRLDGERKGNIRGWCNQVRYNGEREFLYKIFVNLLKEMESCLKKMEDYLNVLEKGRIEQLMLGWGQHLTILKELSSLSKLYQGAEDTFWKKLKDRKTSICHLIVKFAKRVDDHRWIHDHKEVTNFEARRHLAMMMLPDVKDEYDELHEMLIDRSQLLSESFEYISRAEITSLRAGLFMEFKNEEATGPGVLREWFFLVCQAIFNQQKPLFIACPNDRRRFFPNPASKVDPLHLEYFSFCGRVIALALMHKVQIGIVFDRVFFVQLCGKSVCLEDTRDADPYLYNSCKQILEMDAETVDSDALGLTFVRETEELGCRKVVELCPDGKSITVTSKNREEYVNLLIKHCFVTSVAQQVSCFSKGFRDIISCSLLQNSFFQSLYLQDFDAMLHGSETIISVQDWKAHTEYNGYKETDPQITWFWKVLEEMSGEQRKILLFFWTSIKYLPVEGFSGLASRLYIYKTPEPLDRLPSSHTCFYRLCFPAYSSKGMLKDRYRVITQEHVGCSFGTW